MRVWVDISNSPQVPFFRPLIGLLQGRGHEVVVTTREYAQTVELLSLHGIDHDVVGPEHGGAGTAGKARAMAGRLRALRRFARGRAFDLALSHASHELPMVARSLGIPSAYAFDYEFARAQHGLGCRAARRVVVPDAIPQDRLDRLGARAGKVRRYPGLKEEYYLSGFEPDRSVLASLGLDASACWSSSVRLPKCPSTTGTATRCSPTCSRGSVETRTCRPSSFLGPRGKEMSYETGGTPSFVVPEHAIDAQSVVALADLVVSAGGTMNREAVALGVPVYTTFAGKLGAVDELLVRDGRLRLLTSADALELAKRPDRVRPNTREPALLLDLMLSALES